ncbi:MAG TPA: type II secretion system F family protein [Candidatus Nanoarchaeia archaeon]|nr:type II secretion system F family protein [Candidatus Nanoarchaeia archaeon]
MNLYLEELGSAFIPRQVRPYIRKYLQKAGIYEVPYKAFGALFYAIMLITFILFFLYIQPQLTLGERASLFGITTTIGPASLFLATFVSWVIVPLLLSGIGIFSLKVYYDVLIYQRTKEIERILPDFLQAVSTNLKAGMTFDKALWNAIQPDFAVLANEIEIVAKKTMIGQPIEDALTEFSQKYHSNLVRESIDLINVGLSSGASASDLLDRLVKNIRTSMHLRDELVAAVTGNILFITIIAVVIAPLLFALSFNLLSVIQNIGGKLTGTGNAAVLPFTFSAESVDPDAFINFSRVCVLVIAFFASMIIANIKTGTVKGGFKTIPLFCAISIIIYEVSFAVLTNIFQKLFLG